MHKTLPFVFLHKSLLHFWWCESWIILTQSGHYCRTRQSNDVAFSVVLSIGIPIFSLQLIWAGFNLFLFFLFWLVSSCCNLLYTSPCSLGCSLLLWRRVRKRQTSFDFSSIIFDMFSNKPRQKSGVTLFCLRVSTAEDVWADCKKSGRFPPFVWETSSWRVEH